jgi:hypothetical protein
LDRGGPQPTLETSRLAEQIVKSGSGFGSTGHQAFFNSHDLARYIVSAVESQVTQTRPSRFGAAASAILAALQVLIRVRNEESIDYLRPFAEHAKSIPQLTIATLNYDLTIEHICALAGATCSTGIEGWASRNVFNFDNQNVALLKLHGSLDWSRGNVAGRQQGRVTQEVVGKAVDGKHNEHPAIIFGQGNKLTAKGPYLRLFRMFQQRLELTEHLVVMGYSFRDPHINESIAQWMNGSDRRRVTIVSRSNLADKDQAFAQELLALRKAGRARHLQCAVSAALLSDVWWNWNAKFREDMEPSAQHA